MLNGRPRNQFCRSNASCRTTAGACGVAAGVRAAITAAGGELPGMGQAAGGTDGV